MPSLSPHSAIRCASVVLAACLVAACNAAGRAVERFDERSGLTWVVGDAPVVFARTEPRYSRSARDYVYLGPVEINNRGTREQLLWVGLATTIDRGYLAPRLRDPDRLIVMLDGEPLELLLEPWSERVPVLEGMAAYEPSVRPDLQLAARVTRNQLEMIFGGSPGSVEIGSADSGMREFFRWDRRARRPEFLSTLSGP